MVGGLSFDLWRRGEGRMVGLYLLYFLSRLLWPNRGYELRVSYIAVTGEVMKDERGKIYQVPSFPTVGRGLLQKGDCLISLKVDGAMLRIGITKPFCS